MPQIDIKACPHCGHTIDFAYQLDIPIDAPFRSYDPMDGLMAYGPYDIKKILRCDKKGMCHFVLDEGMLRGEHRLVKYNY